MGVEAVRDTVESVKMKEVFVDGCGERRGCIEAQLRFLVSLLLRLTMYEAEGRVPYRRLRLFLWSD